MDCKTVQNYLYDDKDFFENCADQKMPFVFTLRVALHLFFCAECAAHKKIINRAHTIMQNDFMPKPDGLSDAVMAMLRKESKAIDIEQEHEAISLLGWVVAGIIILASVVSAYFGVGYLSLQQRQDLSFILPMGITVGGVITAYGAIFIGSHLRELHELTKKLGLR
jgi:hypothetical protein